jgi:hypothetical protein
MSSKVINISVPMSHAGQHYPGVTLHDGVSVSIVDAPCGPARQMLAFTGCAKPVKPVFLDCVSAIEDGQDKAVPGYLQLKP